MRIVQHGWGGVSSFYVWLDTVDKKMYWLKVLVSEQVDYVRDLYVNGKKATRLTLNNEEGYIVRISADILKRGLNKFTIRTQDVERYCDKNPNSTDTRMLTMYVKSIGLYSNPS